MTKWGSIEGKRDKEGEFNDPRGITVNENYVYICDCDNHRIQLLTKEKGIYVDHWGNFGTQKGKLYWPYSIALLEDIFYIGDNYSVQLWTKEYGCIQRIGGDYRGSRMNQLSNAYGMCIMDDQLYISDSENKRILIFHRADLTF